jgi:hypothetical protein
MRKKVEKLADVLDASDFRWPKKGDRLFKRSQSWDGGVGFSVHPYARDAHIWDGYMTAASVLVERCRNNDVSRFDLVYRGKRYRRACSRWLSAKKWMRLR